ncbi:D-alanyl-D-alanine carboxypeptidase family protein [Streptomyces sp. NPDC014861]|uniref:D-alanyl-D-alanine carboxypeptidase family protein n=1 Tax=Streptomyces sp. NPDC014861 TaxID=3364923 RepID=UPI0036FE965C
MIVTSALRHTAAGSAAMLLVLSAPVSGVAATPPRAPASVPALVSGSVTEPTPPARRFVDRARLDRSGTQVQPLSGAPDVPSLSALSWVVADAGTGEVLAARSAHRRLPPASTLKTLFALTALPHHEASEQHTVADEELMGIGEGSSLVGVKEGYTYRVSDLWNGVFLSSGNDAVRVLASMSGGWRSMARQMQDKARSLGAVDTHVVSPDGYDAPGQVSSAYDLAVFGRAGVQDPDFVRYSSTAYADFPAGSWSFGIANTNRLVTGEDGVGRYPGILGIKNGYTSNAGNTLVAAARRGERTLVVSVMNPQSGGGLAVYEEARDLLDWGFEAAGKVQPVGSLLPPKSPEPESEQVGESEQVAKSERGPGSEPVTKAEPERPDARPVSVRGGAGGPAAAQAAVAPAAATADPEGDGPSVTVPLALVASAGAAALALWAWRRWVSRA